MTRPANDLAPLRARLKGRVLSRSDDDFETVAFGRQWNQRRPTRAPDVIAVVDDEQDVVEAVRFATANNLKVAVRGGGHNWCSLSLRDGGLMIDLANLDQVVSIDPVARTAVVQPVISNRDAQAALNAHGLAFPTGHCPQVKLSGYLLGGGMAWNQGVWGEGFRSVRAIELVTPAGELVTASESDNADYFWAARGAGPGLFAVAVRYHLQLYPLPQAIWASTYSYALDDLESVAGWLGTTAPTLSEKIELTLFLVHADDRKVGLVTATVFANSEDEARALLEPLANCPFADPLSRLGPVPTDFPTLFDLSGSMWPENQRAHVDAMFFDTDPAELVSAVRENFVRAPSETTLLLFSIYTGPDVPVPPPGDAAFSMSARVYGGPWTQWTAPADGDRNLEWHAECVTLLEPYAVGHYVGESDTVGHPEFAEGAYSPANWKKLAELRAKYDPDGVFFSYSEGLGSRGSG